MRLTVLGANGTWPTPGGATSGYLLTASDYRLWVDLGTGTMANLQRHAGLFDVDAVVLSHAHTDHFVDLYAYFYARHFSPERPLGTPLFAPPGLLDAACGLLSEETANDLRRSFDSREVEPGSSFDAGPFRVATRPMRHPVPTLGMRIEAGGAVLAYTADTGPTEEVLEIARGADLVLAEATWGDADQEGEVLPPIHLTAREAGEHAKRAGGASLMLTHIWPTHDLERSRAAAEDAFGGSVELARENGTVQIGPEE